MDRSDRSSGGSSAPPGVRGDEEKPIVGVLSLRFEVESLGHKVHAGFEVFGLKLQMGTRVCPDEAQDGGSRGPRPTSPEHPYHNTRCILHSKNQITWVIAQGAQPLAHIFVNASSCPPELFFCIQNK